MMVPTGISSPEDLPEDYESQLGSRETVRAVLADLLPDADFSDENWVRLKTADFVIEFILGSRDPVTTLGLRINGSDGALATVRTLCEHTGWRAYDTSMADFIDFAKYPERGLQAWRGYKDRVIDNARLPDTSDQINDVLE